MNSERPQNALDIVFRLHDIWTTVNNNRGQVQLRSQARFIFFELLDNQRDIKGRPRCIKAAYALYIQL